ncbi:MAG: hypothetical protein GKS06_15660 [Acidobacteria bacterium]|nr:hypothetical protein [Acidobacteriota bacterium]
MVVQHALPAGEYVFATLGDVSGAEFRDAVRFVVPPASAATAGQQEN